MRVRRPLVVILVVAALVRTLGALGDLWMDEIWSVETARSASSLTDFFLTLHHDSNHILSCLWFYCIGTDASDFMHRLPSVLAGVVSVWVASRLVAHRGALDASIAAFVVAISYVPVHFSSEARGYAPMGMFALIALLSAGRLQAGSARGTSLVALNVCLVLGPLAHLTFLHFFGPFVLWSAWTLLRQRGVRSGVAEFLRWNGIALACLALLYVTHLSELVRGAGPDLPYANVITRALSVSVGGPTAGLAARVVAGATALLFLFGVWRLRSERRLSALLLLGVTVMGPLLLLSTLQPSAIAVRYFFPCTLLSLVVLSTLAADGLRAGGRARAFSVLALVAFTAGSARHDLRLLRVHRGEPRAVLQYIVDASEGETVWLGSNHDVSLKLLMKRYGPRLTSTKRLEFFEQGDWPAFGLDWLMAGGDRDFGATHPTLTDDTGHEYILEHESSTTLFAGGNWFVYRRATPRRGGD